MLLLVIYAFSQCYGVAMMQPQPVRQLTLDIIDANSKKMNDDLILLESEVKDITGRGKQIDVILEEAKRKLAQKRDDAKKPVDPPK